MDYYAVICILFENGIKATILSIIAIISGAMFHLEKFIVSLAALFHQGATEILLCSADIMTNKNLIDYTYDAFMEN